MRNKLYAIFGLVIAIGLFAGIYVAVLRAFDFFLALNSDVAKALVAAGATILVATISLILSKQYEQRLLIRKEHREKKVPVYETLIEFLFRITFWQRLGIKQPTERDIVSFFNQFTQKMIVWGSDDVIKAYGKFRIASMGHEGGDLVELILVLEDLFLAIRKDLGHKNSGFTHGTILTLYINDINEVIAAKTEGNH